jgi:hypothetical protein
VSNCIFRANGAAVLLSSRRADARRAKYRLAHVVRTNLAADDQAYNCVLQMDDDEQKVGGSCWLGPLGSAGTVLCLYRGKGAGITGANSASLVDSHAGLDLLPASEQGNGASTVECLLGRSAQRPQKLQPKQGSPPRDRADELFAPPPLATAPTNQNPRRSGASAWART